MSDVWTSILGSAVWAIIGLIGGFILSNLKNIRNRKIIRTAAKRSIPILAVQKPKQYKGLILLIGQEIVCHKAIRYHQNTLTHCWLVYTKEKRKVMTDVLSHLDVVGIKDYRICLDDPNDFLQIRNIVDDIYKNLPDGLYPKDVIVDFTGMTKPLSVGAVLACLDDDRSIQYTVPLFTKNKDGKPIEPRDPIEILINWDSVGVQPNLTNQSSDVIYEK